MLKIKETNDGLDKAIVVRGPFTNLRSNFGGFSSEAGVKIAATYLTFMKTCKLMNKTAVDFFKGFFSMTSGGRTDYELIVQELLC